MSFSFTAGDIIYVEEVTFTDHPKYQLVLSIKEDYFFIINSEINNTIALNNDWAKCQVKLNKTPNYTFFTKDECYIACHQLIYETYSVEIEKKISDGKARIVGKICKEELDKVIEIVENDYAKTLTLNERKEILTELKKITYNKVIQTVRRL